MRESSAHFAFATKRLQTICRLAQSLQNYFGPILNCQGTFSTLGVRRACAASDLKCAKVLGTLSSRSNLSKRLAVLPRVCRTILGPFQTARKLLALWASACACAASDLKCAKVEGCPVHPHCNIDRKIDRKRRSHKQNHCSASVSVGLIFTRSYRSTRLITTQTTTPSLVKTRLKEILGSCLRGISKIIEMSLLPAHNCNDR